MKISIKIVVNILLLYAILKLLINSLLKLLSLGPQTNIMDLIEIILIPYYISIVSMTYCIIRLWSHSAMVSQRQPYTLYKRMMKILIVNIFGVILLTIVR